MEQDLSQSSKAYAKTLRDAYQASKTRPMGEEHGFYHYISAFQDYYQSHYHCTVDFPKGFCEWLSYIHGYFSGVKGQALLKENLIQSKRMKPWSWTRKYTPGPLSVKDLSQHFETYGLPHIKNQVTPQWLSQQIQTIHHILEA